MPLWVALAYKGAGDHWQHVVSHYYPSSAFTTFFFSNLSDICIWDITFGDTGMVQLPVEKKGFKHVYFVLCEEN